MTDTPQRPRARRRHGAKKLDLTSMREVLRDGRVWGALGLVTKDGDSHWSFDEDGDVLVEVELVPSGETLTCRLACVAGGAGRGIWSVPPVGSEVAIMMPEGSIDAEPMIVGVLSSGSTPDGIGENVTVIANVQVLVHDGAGGAVSLALKSDVQEVVDAIVNAVPSTSGPDAGVQLQATMVSALNLTGTPTGTSVLKGK